MKSKLPVFRFTLIIISAVLIAVGCTKIDTTTIGSGVLPAVDNINTFEQYFDVEVRNYTDTGSDTTEIFSSDAHALGYLNDPVFGKTEATIYLQPGLPVEGAFYFPVKKDSLFLDSAVLVVPYNGVYGDSVAAQSIKAYRITDPNFKIDFSKAAKLNQQFVYNNSELLGSATVSPADVRARRVLSYRKDSVASNQLRISLSNTFAQSLLEQDSSGNFKTDSIFKLFLRGIALVPAANGSSNSLMYFQQNNARILLYHRLRKSDGSLDTTVQGFPVNLLSANGNYIKRDRSSGEVAGHLDNNTPDQTMYLQGAPGTFARITIPGLENLSNRIVHRAELVMKQIWTGPQKVEDDLFTSNLIYPEIYNTDSNAVSTDDSLIYNPLLPNVYVGDFFFYVGGTRKDTLDANSKIVAKYNINLTRYLQAIVTRKRKNYPLQLSIPYRPLRFQLVERNKAISPYSFLASGRLKAGGGNHPQYKMYLRIIYSKIQ